MKTRGGGASILSHVRQLPLTCRRGVKCEFLGVCEGVG